MKTIHNINKWSFIITLLLYLTILGGMLAQLVLGGIQLLLAFSILFYWKILCFKAKRLLFIYGGLLISYVGVLWIAQPDMSTNLGLILYFPIPMTIAAYFLYVTYRVKKYQYQIDFKPSYY